MPTVPIINKPVFEIVSSSKESRTLQRAMALTQLESPFDADKNAVDSDIDDYMGKSAIDDNDDSFD
ncbi:hypothetical protein BFJ69_g17272 [Fusarium oxysporum]|uniref:Uncharacterized protein n=1 Tax=Fusarium oxysporum TaxID=5507 RepID=A0A420M8R6_FUSOX|nr:hypothetical protein BFJ69_g17272 [Fusarium oxysporum]